MKKYTKEDIIKFTETALSLEDLKNAKTLYYQLNDMWGETWTDTYREFFTIYAPYDYFMKTFNGDENLILTELKYHRFRYEKIK